MATVFPKFDSATKLDANYLQMYALSRVPSVQIAPCFSFFLVLPGTAAMHTEWVGDTGGGFKESDPLFFLYLV